MSDNPEATDATNETPAPTAPVPTPTPAPARRFDVRVVGVTLGATGVLVLAFIAGVLVGDERGEGGGEREHRRGPFAEFAAGSPEAGRGGRGAMELPPGAPAMPGKQGNVSPGGPGGGGPSGGDRQGPMHGAGLGVVEKASASELTLDMLRGEDEQVTVLLDDDVEVHRRGDDGARDIEDAEVGDIDVGDIVVIHEASFENDDSARDEDPPTITAKSVVILRDSD